MKKNKKILCFGVSLVLVLGGVIAVKQKQQIHQSLNAEEGNYSIQLNSENTVSGLTASYGSGAATVNGVQFNFVTAKTSEGKLAQLGNFGYIENFDASSTYKSRITSIKSIKVVFSGVMYLETGINRVGNELGQRAAIISGNANDLSTTKPYYFRLLAGEGGAIVESVQITYTCSVTSDFALEWLANTYTGKGSDGYTYKLTRNGSNAVIETLDREENASFNGTIAMNGNQSTCTFQVAGYPVAYVSQVSEDGSTISYVSKSGAAAAYVAEIDFHKVYEVENFESYTEAGVGWDNYNGGHAYENKTGLRASFYCDYYSGSGSSPIGGTNWSLMGSQDYLGYNATNGHNGSKAALMKASSAGGMRYLQSKLYEGNQYIIGRGKTLSVWVHSAYTSSYTDSTVSPKMKIYGYYNNKVTASTQTYRTEVEYTIQAGSGWKQYTLNLDQTKNYYGFGIYFASTSAACYMLVDDVQIYTEDLYAKYEEPVVEEGDKVTMTVLGSANIIGAAATILGKDSIPVKISLGGTSTEAITVEVNGSDAGATEYEYDSKSGSISIATTGNASGLTYGTITGNVDVANGRITNLELDGTLKDYVGNNGSITCQEAWGDRFNYSSNSASQLVWQRWYGSTWTANSGSGEWTTSSSTYKLEEDYSMGLRIAGSSYTRTGFTLKQDLGGGAGVKAKGVSIWLYNSGTVTYSGDDFRIFAYKTASTTSGDHAVPSSTFITAATATKSIAPGQWTHIEVGFTEATIYNLRLYFAAKSANTEYVYVAHMSLY